MKNKIYSSIVMFDKEVAIKWFDGEESFIDLFLLRKSCPCAWCSGEKDAFGNVYKGPKKTLSSHAYIINSYEGVGLYGVRFFYWVPSCTRYVTCVIPTAIKLPLTAV